MKFCPKCRTQYTDDMLQFCLQDGTPLSAMPGSAEHQTVAFGESETVASPRTNEPLRFEIPRQTDQTFGQNRVTSSNDIQPEPRKSNTLLIILATVLAMSLIFGIFGAVGWFYFKAQDETAKNTANTSGQNSEINAGNKANANKSSIANSSPKVNANAENTVPNVSKTPVSAADKEKIRADVSNRLDNWQADGESLDLDSYMQNYAPTVDYYNKKSATNSQVRSDKKKAFDLYDSITVEITDLTITADETGETATAVFDKEWTFDGEQASSSGKVRQELRLKKINNKWLITSEKDLKLYYKD